MTYVKDSRTGYQTKIVDVVAEVAAHEAKPDPHPQYLTATEGNAAYATVGHNHDADYADIGHTHAQLHDAVTVSDTDTLDLTLAGQAVSGAVKKQMSIDSDTSGLKLVNDSTTPGNNKVYGTDASGVKGWKADPSVPNTLNDLTDVTITTPSNGQVLKYNGSSWVNDTDATGGGGGSRELKITIDGGGAAIATGVGNSFLPVAVAGTVAEWYITGNPSGSIVVDILKKASAIPSGSDSMTGGTDRPTLSSATVNSDTTLSGWTSTTLSVGDVLGVNVISCTDVETAVITLKVT